MFAAKAAKYWTLLEPWNCGRLSSASHSLKRKLVLLDLLRLVVVPKETSELREDSCGWEEWEKEGAEIKC
jgi:hypothetical protein